MNNEKVEEKKKEYWVALESNPDMMNDFAWKLGLSKDYSFRDCWAIDPESVTYIARPVYAFILLFPFDSKGLSNAKSEQQKRIEKEGQTVSKNAYFMFQHVANACGSIAIVHTIINNYGKLKVEKGSLIEKFRQESLELDPSQRGHLLGQQQAFEEISNQSAKETGQTKAPEIDDNVNNHFIVFVEIDGDLYELDGEKKFPINHGKVTDFVEDSSKAIQTQFFDVDPEANFSIIILGDTKDL
eukprot:TRINITY_DN509_c0_g1_i1.p1 TRINITY_DN509_c0_g1~~TRINITY_DN509_c0_g1_i1.p1  ORF type:complete len:249 (-),score=96.85 TRINITY_DN509_c0_g1_i1:46-771(-)